MTDGLLSYIPQDVYVKSDVEKFPEHNFYYTDFRFRVLIHRSRFHYDILCSTDEYGMIGISYGLVRQSRHKILADAILEYRRIVYNHSGNCGEM